MNDKFSSRFLLYMLHLFLSLIIVLICTGEVTAQTNEANLSFRSLLRRTDQHTVKNLSSGWQIRSEHGTDLNSVDLPLLLGENNGTVRFIKNFVIPDSLRSRRLLLRIDGMSGMSTIKFNNIAILQRDHLPTAADIPVNSNLLNLNGENVLEIALTLPEKANLQNPDMVNLFNGPRYAGITGDIYLYWPSPSYISKISSQYATGILNYDYSIQIANAPNFSGEIGPKLRCEEEVVDPDGQIIFKRFEYIPFTDGTPAFSRTVAIKNPKTWSSDTPRMHRLRFRVLSGSGIIAFAEQEIGLRNVLVSDNRLQVNDQALQIRGINYRLPFPILDGFQPSRTRKQFYSTLRSDLKDIKSLGFNAIRLPNTPPHSFVLYLADSLGLYCFAENGLWRVPDHYFTEDKLLQSVKHIADQVADDAGSHPAFIAFGIGNEVPLHRPVVKKFYMIAKGYMHQKMHIPLYISPLDPNIINEKAEADLIIHQKYDRALLENFPGNHPEGILLGNVGFALPDLEGASVSQAMQSAYMQTFFKKVANNTQISGYFIESYRDWPARVAASVTMPDSSGKLVYPYGLKDFQDNKRDLYNRIPSLFAGDFYLPAVTVRSVKKTNFFSISVFLFSIIFFLIYRQNYRFRENLKRALAHPYGFSVDLRDRRIISIFNSSMIGLFTNFLVSTVIAAYLFYFSDNLWLEEFMTAILAPLNLKAFYLELLTAPYKISIFLWFCFYLLQLSVVIFLKILNLFAVEKIRFRQYLAASNWSGAPLLLLLPVSMLSFHLMRYTLFHKTAVIIMVLSFLWYNFRLGNSIRVLQMIHAYIIFIIITLGYGSVFFSLGYFLEAKDGVVTYIRLLTDAGFLF